MFERLELIIGKDNVNKLNNTKVLVIGLGGVGGILTETLVRNGIKDITIIDNDIVDITNKNRQIIAMDSTVGKNKADVMKERLLDINKDCKITVIKEFIDGSNIDLLFDNPVDHALMRVIQLILKFLLLRSVLKEI